jgi:hypothetical protein
VDDRDEQMKQIKASYALGQDSIEAIRSKLVGKMDRSERVSDKSDRNDHVFKQKLKRLGSSNFFLKRAGDKDAESSRKRTSAASNHRSKVEFSDFVFDMS